MCYFYNLIKEIPANFDLPAINVARRPKEILRRYMSMSMVKLINNCTNNFLRNFISVFFRQKWWSNGSVSTCKVLGMIFYDGNGFYTKTETKDSKRYCQLAISYLWRSLPIFIPSDAIDDFCNDRFIEHCTTGLTNVLVMNNKFLSAVNQTNKIISKWSNYVR